MISSERIALGDSQNEFERQIDKLKDDLSKYEKEGSDLENVGVCSVKGPRKYMEDGHCVISPFFSGNDSFLFGVYDGHSPEDGEGGRCSVDYLEENLHIIFEKNLKKCSTVKEAMVRSLKEADKNLNSFRAQENGATVVLGFCCPVQVNETQKVRRLFVCNCGDARAVLFRQKKKTKEKEKEKEEEEEEEFEGIRLTVDHKASSKEEKKRIFSSGGIVASGRVFAQLAVSRAVGDHSLKKYVITDPHYTEINLTKRDKILILACDGVWDVLNEEDVAHIVKKLREEEETKGKKLTPKIMADEIVDIALKKGTQDNVTCIVSFL